MATEEPILKQLMQVIEDRKKNPSERSYTTRLFAGGVEKIGEKILEEAGEVVAAARAAETNRDKQHVIHEAADLLFHLLVMLGHCGVSLKDVDDELARRFGTSGLDEKASRQRKDSAE